MSEAERLTAVWERTLIMINNTGGAVLNIQSSEITGQGVVQNVGGIVNITGGTLTASARNTVLSQFGRVHIGASAILWQQEKGNLRFS